jgi:hypothetical protein
MHENGTFTRWAEVVALVAGAVLALSPIWVSVDASGIATLIVLGSLLFLGGLLGAATPSGRAIAGWSNLVLGVLTFIAPWVIGYHAAAGAAWTSWVIGVIAFVVGLVVLRPHRGVATHRGTLAPGTH